MDQITRADALASGLKRYFTGEPCRNGHIAERIVRDRDCVECACTRSRLRARDPKVRDSRREYMNQHQRNWRRKNPDRWKAIAAKRKDADTAARRERRAKDPSKDRAALRRSFQKHKAKRMAETREWKKNNKEANSRLSRVDKARRRSRELAAAGSYSRQDIEALLVSQNFVCAACPAHISQIYQVDHMMPLSRGGSNWPSNLQLLCPTCNRSKGNKTMEEWQEWKLVTLPGCRAGLALPMASDRPLAQRSC